FFSLLENGWHLLLIAPRNYYYSQAFRLMPVIFILALSLASILGFLLVRLSAAKKRSEDESRSKSYFLARMSHEIRTPLNAIIGLGELAIRRYGQPQGKNDLEEIRRAGYNLLAIANDILDLSKVESGRLEINPGPYKTAALLSDVLVLAKATLGDRDLELSVSADPDLPAELVGDETLVRQVIMNLMTNAIKYTAEGFIRLHLKGEPAGEDQIRLLFTIEDSGPGLKPEQTALIFDDFVRLDGQQTEGTGLGLPIARSFCRAMGGDISVTSEFGRGTAFLAEIRQTVASPGILLGEFKPARPSPDQGPGRPAPFLVPDFRVLIVDDIATNLEVADGLLSLYQMRTTLALSGREAIEAARKNDYDLFFIDHMMPNMDGLATLKALRQINEATGAAPMIALTASALAGMREMFLDNGFDDYLTKPIEMKSLNELLERLVPPGRRVTAPDQPAARPFQEEALAAAAPLEGFDPAAGQNRLGGSAEKYRAVLAIFLRDLESRRPLLAAEMDRDSLIINLHALKAALANIGALTLAAEAAVLEAAAKRNDQPTLAAELRPFKAGLDQLESVVRAGLKTEEPRDPSPGSLSAETLRELKAALKAQDIGRIDETCERLSRAAPGGSPARATLAAISDHILMTDYQEAEELVDQLLREAENE
ncbi:MAG: response regulator, partial [Candidatus Adiutrix sp.]|nr:response regulator [Candidatus Adiutrix sp.]